MGHPMAKKKKSVEKPAKAAKPKAEITAPPEPKVESAAPETFREMFFPPEPQVAESADQPTVVKTEKVLYRCIAENSIYIRDREYGRRFGPGQIVDLDAPTGKGFTLREHVRLGCFAPIKAGGK